MVNNLPPPTTHPLFAGSPIEEAFAAQRAKALATIAALSADDLLSGDMPRVRTELLETYRIAPLRLDWDAHTTTPAPGPGKGGGSVWSVCVVVPFRGAQGLFDMVPTQRGRERPEGCVRPAELVLVIHAGHADPDRELERQKTLIMEWVARINSDVDRFNREIAATIRMRLASAARDARRSAELALELGPPLRRRVTPLDDGRSTRSRTANAATLAVPPVGRKAGRPRWTYEQIRTRRDAAVAATPEPRTLRAIAANFRPLGGHELGISAGQLGRLLSRIAPPSE